MIGLIELLEGPSAFTTGEAEDAAFVPSGEGRFRLEGKAAGVSSSHPYA